jgi:hypothetical protein
VGEAALQLLEAAYAQAGRRLAPYAQTKAWQQITRVWQTTSEAWKQVRELVTRQGFQQTAEQLLRTLATRAADAIAGLAERAVSRLNPDAPLAGPARQALTNLATTTRDVAAKIRPLTPAAADLRATHTRVRDQYRQAQAALDNQYRQAQAAVDAAFTEILASFPSTVTRQQQPGQQQGHGPAAAGPEPVGGKTRPAGEQRPADPGSEPTPAMRRWAGVVREIDPSLLGEPEYRRLAAAMERAQSAAEGGADVTTLLPQLAARGTWTQGGGTTALRLRLVKECPAAATPLPSPAMAAVGASATGSRPPEQPPVPAPPRPAPRRGR